MKSSKKIVQLSEKGYFLTDVQRHYVASGTHLVNKNILQNKYLQCLCCLNSDFKNTPKSVKIIAKLGHCLPIDIETDTLLDEWKKLPNSIHTHTHTHTHKMKVNRIN